MSKLIDIVQTGIREEDLGDLGQIQGVGELVRIINIGFRSLYGVVNGSPTGGAGITFADNFRCVVAFPKLTHGVPQSVATGSLLAKGILVLGADKGHAVMHAQVSGSSTQGQAKVTAWFRDSSAASIAVACVLLSEGIQYSGAPKAIQAWQNVTFSGAWGNYGGGNSNVQYIKDSLGFVHLRGVASGVAGPPSDILTFPAGYRPLSTLTFAITSNGAFGYVTISSAGVVTLRAGSTVWASLEGITFLGEQ